MNKSVDARATVNSGAQKNNRIVIVTYAVSMLCHMLFFAVIIYGPALKPQKKFIPSVINVSMVSFSAPEAVRQPAKPTKPAVAEPEVQVAVKKTQPEIKAKPQPEPVPEPVVSIKKKSKKAIFKKNIPKKPKPKQSLKKKTFKRTKVLKSAIRRIEKDIEKSRPDPLKTAIDKLRQKVGDADMPVDRKIKSAGIGPNGSVAGQNSGLNTGQTLELINIYRIEIAYQIQKNWAFSDQLAGGRSDLKVSLVFKIMPDGEIRNIFFTDRSGNNYLDESAYNAIVKSSPVKGHPEGTRRPYVEMGVEFTPEGIN